MSRGPKADTKLRTSKLLTLHDLNTHDRAALRDLVRFGVMADYQIARRYADPLEAEARLPLLTHGGIVFEWRQSLEDARVYSPSRYGQYLANMPGVDPRKQSPMHLAHDVTLVDLADTLLAGDASLQWRTEREVRQFLDQIASPPPRLRGDRRRPHRPDGVLLEGAERIGIELEHSQKNEQRYAAISRWFVLEWRLDRVRWYIDTPRIVDRLRRVNEEHGYDRDMLIQIEPLPPGVRFRKRPGPFDS